METCKQRVRDGEERECISLLFCAELRDGSKVHAGNVSSWQNKPPPRLDTRQNCSNPSRCLHRIVPTPWRDVQYVYTHSCTDTHTVSLVPPHMQSHRFDKLSGCQQMLNLLRSLIPPHSSPSNTHIHTHTLCTYFTFLHPPSPTARLCSRCFNDML